VTALAAASLHDRLTGTVRHAMTEAVLLGTTTLVGLVRTLHWNSKQQERADSVRTDGRAALAGHGELGAASVGSPDAGGATPQAADANECPGTTRTARGYGLARPTANHPGTSRLRGETWVTWPTCDLLVA